MPFELSQEQNNKLKELTENGNSNFPAGYGYLKEIVDGALKNNSLSATDKKIMEEQSFWLGKAIEINANNPDSEANTFIRDVTRNGLAFDNKTATPDIVQANSNLIANSVISGIIKDGKIPEITDIIRGDALSAIEKGGQTVGGWGGAFNYWNLSLDPNNALDTVGNRILKSPAEYEKFLAVNSAAIAKTMGKFGLTPEQILTALGSALSPKAVGDIINRLAEALTEGFGFAGDPNNIDGYKPSIGQDGKITGWWSFDKDLKRIEVTDDSKVKELTDRHDVRTEKGSFHHWQDPTVGTKTHTLHLDDGTTVTQNFNDDGDLVSSSSVKSDKTRTDLTYDPATGKISSRKDFDAQGNVIDKVDEKAEADRLAAEQAAADKLRADQAAQAAAMEEQHKKDEQNRLELENKQEEQRKKTEDAYNQQLEQNQQRAEEERKKIEAAKAKAEANRLAAEKAEAKQKADKEKADADRPDKEKSGGGKTEAEQAEAEKAAAAKVEADRLAAEKAEADRLAAEQAAADKLRADQAAQAAAMEEQRKKDEQNRLEQEKQKKEDDDRKHAEELEKQKNDTINNINNGLNNSIKNPLGASGQQNFPNIQIPGPSLSPPPMNIPIYTNPNSDFSPFSSHGGGAPGVSTGFQNPPIPSSRPFTPSGGGGGVYIGSPVVLDLNHNGHLDIRPLDTQDKTAPKNETEHDLSENTKITPRFDWNADGVPDPTAWVGPQDGLLVIDLAKDGTAGSDGVIDQPKEIAFALWKTEDERVAELKAQGLDDKGIPVTDLEGLRWAFDSNHDNVLDMHDDRWNEFRVWQDANQNGITDQGELLTMDQAGIKLINLMPSSEGSKAFPDGSAITGTSTAQMTDGTKMLVGDVSLAYRPSLAG